MKAHIDEITTHTEFYLLCDVAAMISSVYYNHSTGNCDGYVNCDENIIVPNKDVVAKKPLVSMLVSFQGNWKHPEGYLLGDKVNTGSLNCLLSTILDLCCESNISVKGITMDSTAVNVNSIKLFGCKLGHSFEEIIGGFSDWN